MIPKQLSSHKHGQATTACLTACLTTSKHRLHIPILHPVYITNMRLARHTGTWQCHVGLASAQPALLFPQSRDFSTQYWGRVKREAEMAEGNRTTLQGSYTGLLQALTFLFNVVLDVVGLNRWILFQQVIRYMKMKPKCTVVLVRHFLLFEINS